MMKSITALTFALLLFVAAPGALGAQEAGDDLSPAAELRAIDAELVRKHAPDVELPSVHEYADMIERVEAKCTWGWGEINVPGYVRTAHEALEAEDVHRPTYAFLKGVDDFYEDEDSAEKRGISCGDLIEHVVDTMIADSKPGAGSGGAADGGQRDERVSVTETSPIEAHLLSYDGETTLVQGPSVVAYGELLDRAAAKCPEDRRTVGKIAIAGHFALKEGGVRLLNREILEGIIDYWDHGEIEGLGKTCRDLMQVVVEAELGEGRDD